MCEGRCVSATEHEARAGRETATEVCARTCDNDRNDGGGAERQHGHEALAADAAERTGSEEKGRSGGDLCTKTDDVITDIDMRPCPTRRRSRGQLGQLLPPPRPRWMLRVSALILISTESLSRSDAVGVVN